MNFRTSRTRSRRNSLNIMASAEKWRSYGRKLSCKGNEYLEEDSEDDIVPQTSQVENWFEEFFGQRNIDTEESDQDIEINLTKKQTLILSTLVPDEILLMKTFNTREPTRFVGVLLMADVSGYTALSEKYNNTGKSGTYKLTVTLNTYLGSLIEVIYSHGGDIIKFAGDAFLALWKTDKRTFLCHTIHTVIACALIIQQCFGTYETDVKVNLKVKLAISAGNLIFTPIGSGIDMNYIITGLPVIEAKIAESLCASGEVKLTPTAWGHCYSRNYDHFIDTDEHVTIKSILYDPRETNVSKPFVGLGNMMRPINKPFIALENLPDSILETFTKVTNLASSKKNELLSLRKTILLADEMSIGTEIRRFMIRPILTQIDAHQPLEYLTEMRQVSVLFVTLKPKECTFLKLITLVNNSYQITCDIVYKSMGCVNKIILFDKDIMILVIFGLRGFKHESEAQAALKCAYSIKKSVSALDGVLNVSIGVTTGQVYCGVVGHPLRREFTVIGAIVNKAARLMCGFRNKITCDEATFVKSKMSSNGFTLQPATELKGILQPGKIYEYTEDIRVKELQNIPLIPPLLNRYSELSYFENWLQVRERFRDFDALLLIGESRIGKTRLIEWMARYAKNKNYNVCYINLTSIHSATKYLALNQIIEQMLGITEPVVEFKKEQKLVNLLTYYNEDLCYLNNVLNVRFAYHEGVSSLSENMRQEKAKDMFKKLLSCLTDTYLILLDNLQNLDANSWDFLMIMFDTMNIYNVFTVTRGKFSAIHSWLYNVFVKKNVKKIILGTLSSEWITPLACQILDVQAVSKDLCDSLESKCNGMPGLIESFLVHLFSKGALDIKKVYKDDLENWQHKDLQFPESILIRPVSLNSHDQPILDQLINEMSTEEISVCYVAQKELLDIDINVQNKDALIMMQIDSLTPYQQLLLKIGSVIGNIISRHLLENIMYENNPITTARAIKRLFTMRILSCANVRYNKMTSNATIASNYSGKVKLACECTFDYDPDQSEKLPKYAFCKIMKFRNKNSRKTFYELLPLNQKKEFHLRIVNYLENNKQKCPECGGTVMIVQSIANLGTNIAYSSLFYANDQFDDEYQFNDDCPDVNLNSSLTPNENNLQKSKSDLLNKFTSEDFQTNNLIISNEKSNKSETGIKNTSQCAPILKVKSSYEDTPRSSDVKERRSTKRVTMSNLFFKNVSAELASNSLYDNLRGVLEAENLSDWNCLGVVDSEDNIKIENVVKPKKSFCIKIEKGASKVNFSKCTCTELNIIILEQLISHAKEAEVKIKVVEFLIKLSHLYILDNNVDSAIPKLDEATAICVDKSIKDISEFDKKRFLGKIYTLKAASNLIDGRLMDAKLYIEKSAKIYKVNLNKVSDIFKIRPLFLFNKLYNQKYRFYNALMKADSVLFLNIATLLYSSLENESTARVAASRSLYLVRRIECNFIDLCDAFTNVIQMELDRGTSEVTVDYENFASYCLQNLGRPIKVEELFAVGKLLIAVFRARIARGELGAAIRSGFRALVISRFLHANKILLDIIPDLFYLLLARRRIDEAVSVVKLLLRLGESLTSLECETWYYALCMDMILDAGIQIETPYEISRYAEFSLQTGKAAGGSRRRLVLGLWTYWLRVDSERKAKRYEIEALTWLSHGDGDGSLKDIISGMRLAEGMLESLARKIDDLRKVVDLMQLRSLAEKELMRLEKDAFTIRSIYPRWIILKASSLNLSGRHTAATVLFNRAMEESKRMKNHLEESLVQANNSNIENWFKNARSGQFLHWYNAREHARTSWHHFLYKIAINRNH